MSFAPIPFYEFREDPGHGVVSEPFWHPITPSSNTTESPPISVITLVTWNVWFDKVGQEARFQGFLKELIALDPVDIVALQEVTLYFVEWLQSSPYIRSNWLLTNRWDQPHEKGIPKNWYGNIFLVRKKWSPCIYGWVKAFPTSKMGRYVALLALCQDGKSVVGTIKDAIDIVDSRGQCAP